MANPFDYRKSKIPVPESPYLTRSRATGLLSDISDQVFYDETLTVDHILDNVLREVPSSSSRDLTKTYPYGPPSILHQSPSPISISPPYSPKLYSSSLAHSIATPGPSVRKSTKRKKPPDILIRTTSDLVESKVEELLGPARVDNLMEDLIVSPLHVSRSMDNLRVGQPSARRDHQDDYDRSRSSTPFQTINDRMDRKKSTSQLHLSGSASPSPSRTGYIRTHHPSGYIRRSQENLASRGASPKKSIKPDYKRKSTMSSSTINLDGNMKPSEQHKKSESKVAKDSKKPPFSKSSDNAVSVKSVSKTAPPTPKKALTAENVEGKAKEEAIIDKDKPIDKSKPVTTANGKSTPTKTISKSTSNLTDVKKSETPSTSKTATATAATTQQPGTSKKVTTVPLKSAGTGEKGVTSSDDKKGTVDHHPKGKVGKKGAPVDAGSMSKEEVSKIIAKSGAAERKGSLAGGVEIPDMNKEELASIEDDPNLTKEEKERRKEMKAYVYRILHLCQKSDWHAVEQALRYLEKAVVLGLTENPKPLIDVADPENGWTPLMYAMKDNRIPLADRMIDLGCDVNAKNKEGFRPIHIASLFARDETVKFLIFKRADVTAVTEGKKQTAVHLVCTRPSGNAKDILKVLLSVAPKDIRLAKDSDGRIPLFIALQTGTRGTCQELLSHLAHEQMRVKAGLQQDTALHMVIRKRDLEAARLFVDAGANVDAKNGDGQTPLHLAAALGDEALVKFFFLCKANPNIADKEDRTPIHLAAQQGHTSIIDTLAEKFKVSVFERTKDGSTLMHIASLHGHPDTAMTLFRKGVPLQMPNKGGARSLHIAAKHGHAGMISKLLEKGEKVDAATNDNYTALHIAVESGRPAVVETLLGYGAQVHIKGGKAQETPLHIAARVNEGDKCALMLLKSGADPNITMENGESPLHVAARNGRLRIIKLLLNDGANPLHRSKDGETPLHLACRFGHLRVVKELLQYILREKGGTDVGHYINTATNKGESALHYASKLSETNSHVKNVHDAAREISQLLLDGGASVYQQTKETHETAFHYCAREGNNDILKEMLSRMSVIECQRALNKQSDKGWSPLLIASHKGHKEVVKTLLENNARVDVFDNEGRSALHLAAEHGYQEVCGMLMKHKAFINSKSRTGFTALHMAAQKGFTKLCLFLIQDHNAYVDVVTLKKQTPLHLAAEAGQLEVCRLLMGLRASADATDERGQRPIHLAAENNHGDVIKLFLKNQPALVSSSTKDGSTCAHLAAMQGSVSVFEELMKFDKQGVISARNRSTDATALQLAAEGGHAELVKTLLEAGASATDENRAGYAAVHLAAKNGHASVIDALRNSENDAISLSSRKLGLTALHIAAYFGQTETVRELLTYIPATTESDPPISLASSFLKELGTESALTPLHLASFSGEENVVRLLLNSQGVLVDAQTANFGFNPLHLACRGGHMTVVGLLLSRSSELLESKDKEGRTGLHIAAIHGHSQMVEILLGQGAEIDSVDKEMWTPLHCACKAGHLDVVKLLMESGASPLAKTAKGQYPIWFAAAENHNAVLSYMMKKEHDSYGLMEDRDFVYNLTVCGKNNNNEPLNEFVLASPAPCDIAAKLSSILLGLSTKEKERAKDLVNASKHCEGMAAELLALASGSESAGKVLRSVDRRSIQFLDVLIENEQKEVIAHTAVQRYLQELWVGNLTWANWKLLLLFVVFLICPPVWIIFSLPLGHKYHKIPIIKFMSYLTSHIYLMILLCLTSITPIYSIFRFNFFPYWYEWILLAWLVGLIISEITNPSDKAGLGWVKVAVLFFCILGVILHGVGFFVGREWHGHIFYLRNQLFAVGILLAFVQVLDFLSFHYLFGPWAIIIGNLMKDLARFLAVLAIFMLGFSMIMASLNQPFHKRTIDTNRTTITNGLPSGVLVTPIDTFDILFFALFGLKELQDFRIEKAQPEWTQLLFKLVYAVYLLISIIVLINLLIAMMSDTYQRIQAQSDVEWKFGLAKLIRNMHRTSATPSPINLFTSWLVWIITQCRKKREPFNPLKWEKRGGVAGGRGNIFQFGKPTPKQRWKQVFNKTKLTPRVSDIMRLSVANVSPMTPGSPLHPLGSTISMHQHQQRIETVADWALVAKKYRVLVGKEEPSHISPTIQSAEGATNENAFGGGTEQQQPTQGTPTASATV